MRDCLRLPPRLSPALLAAALLALPPLVLPAAGQGNGGGTRPPAAAPRTVDSPDIPASDSPVSVLAADDSSRAAAARIPDSSSRPKSRADTVLVVQHSFNHRQQIITGSVVMSCLALMLVIMNNYNPR